MSSYTRLISSVVFPLQERLKQHTTVRVRRALEASQWWPTEQILAAQADRLRAFLVDVGANVPYYRALFQQQGFDPAEVRSAADLRALPLLDKATIRAQGDALRHAQAQGLARFNTGGSSGEPLIFYIGRERVSHDVAAKWRATRWWGVDIGDPEIVVWGSPIELGSQDRVRQLRDAVMRTELLPAFEMNDARLDEFLRRIRARRPRMLFGYPSALSYIARHAIKRGVRMDDLIDVLVYPRHRMRLTDLVTPLKPLECMAQGRVLVASDVGGHRELIEHGVTGQLFAAGSAPGLVDAVDELLQRRAQWSAIREAGRRFVETERNWAVSVGRYAAPYTRLVGR